MPIFHAFRFISPTSTSPCRRASVATNTGSIAVWITGRSRRPEGQRIGGGLHAPATVLASRYGDTDADRRGGPDLPADANIARRSRRVFRRAPGHSEGQRGGS